MKNQIARLIAILDPQRNQVGFDGDMSDEEVMEILVNLLEGRLAELKSVIEKRNDELRNIFR